MMKLLYVHGFIDPQGLLENSGIWFNINYIEITELNIYQLLREIDEHSKTCFWSSLL